MVVLLVLNYASNVGVQFLQFHLGFWLLSRLWFSRVMRLLAPLRLERPYMFEPLIRNGFGLNNIFVIRTYCVFLC